MNSSSRRALGVSRRTTSLSSSAFSNISKAETTRNRPTSSSKSTEIYSVRASTSASLSSCSRVTLAASKRPWQSILTRNSDRFIPRKLTNSFIQKMATLPKLRSKIALFLENEIIPAHRNETNWKIHLLAKKWQALLNARNYDLFEGICKVIEFDPKFKLPWTTKEVDLAIASTKKLFEIDANA